MKEKPITQILYEAEKAAIESQVRYEANKAKYELVSNMLNTIMLFEANRINAVFMTGFCGQTAK